MIPLFGTKFYTRQTAHDNQTRGKQRTWKITKLALPMRLGGLAGCQLTGPVAETPDVDLRRTAASHHQAELGGQCSGGAEVNSIFFVKKLPARKFLANNVFLVAGCDHELIHPRCFGRFRTAEEGLMQRALKLRYELRVSCV